MENMETIFIVGFTIFYLSIAFQFLMHDAFVCIRLKLKYRFWSSFFLTLFWPVSIPVMALQVQWETKHNEAELDELLKTAETKVKAEPVRKEL